MELTDVFLSILWWYVQMGLVVDVSGESSQIAAPFSKIFESLLKSRDEVGDLSVEIYGSQYLRMARSLLDQFAFIRNLTLEYKSLTKCQ